jgi:hypothetical protein
MTGSENGRASRFDALFAAYSPDIVAYCGWRAANADDAQDAVSEVFLAAWRRLDEVPGGDAARVWLYACAQAALATVYSGTVPAGVVARERGFKEGRPVRLLPFGYVAHDQAANPASPLDAQLTVGADGIIRQISVRWGTRTSAWTYTVTYSNLGHTPTPVAPPNPLTRDQLRQQAGQSVAG